MRQLLLDFGNPTPGFLARLRSPIPLGRIEGKAGGQSNAFGICPRYEDLRWDGLAFNREQFTSVIGVDRSAWRDELGLHSALFKQLAHHLPESLVATKARIEARLGAVAD